MSDEKFTDDNEMPLMVQMVQVLGRLGLSMAGAMCGTFVAAQLTMTDAALFELSRLRCDHGHGWDARLLSGR